MTEIFIHRIDMYMICMYALWMLICNLKIFKSLDRNSEMVFLV